MQDITIVLTRKERPDTIANAPVWWSIKSKRWVPKITTLQALVLKDATKQAVAHMNGLQIWNHTEFAYNANVIRSLVKRGWIEPVGPKSRVVRMTSFGLCVIKEFYPEWIQNT